MAVTINSAWDLQMYIKEKEEARQSINSPWDAQCFYETYGGNGYSGNWNSPTRHVGAHGYTYNPATCTWEKSANTSYGLSGFDFDFEMNSGSLSSVGGLGGGFSGGSSGAVSQPGVVNSDSDAATDSKTDAEKEYIDIEFNTLTGEISLLPTKENMKLKVGDTINLKGVGKYLSGLYFISEIKRTLSNDGGYSMSITVYKNGFGDSLKSSSSATNTSPPPASTGRPPQADTNKNVVTNAIKVGSKVKIIGDAIYSNAHEGVKVPEWVKNQTLTVDALSEDGNRARLDPIFSWTYIKYLKIV